MLPRIIHDGVEPMRNREDCVVSKFTPNRLLNKFIGFHVNRRCGFIKNQDFTFTKKCSR